MTAEGQLALSATFSGEPSLGELLVRLGPNLDVVLASVTTAERGTLIEVHRKGLPTTHRWAPGYVAVVTDDLDLDTALPTFSCEQAEALAELILSTCLGSTSHVDALGGTWPEAAVH